MKTNDGSFDKMHMVSCRETTKYFKIEEQNVSCHRENLYRFVRPRASFDAVSHACIRYPVFFSPSRLRSARRQPFKGDESAAGVCTVDACVPMLDCIQSESIEATIATKLQSPTRKSFPRMRDRRLLVTSNASR